ncbi:FkbM family methyltransferase [bacterium]|nr:MAG: FkbM family methyltransferase [bacterium]
MIKYLLNIKRFLGKRLRKFITYLRRRYDIWKYSGFKPNHVFNISVDDISFKMTFKDYKLDFTIIERIEGRREPNTTVLIKALVTKGKNVLQIGGCYGYFANIMSCCAGDKGKVVSIEGTPNNFEILSENIKMNNLTNVRAYKFFVGSGNENIYFDKNERNPYKAIDRFKGRIFPKEMIAVPVSKLTDFLKEIDYHPDIIFMDIEGFEMDVFEDFYAQGYLKKEKPVIVFELHPLSYTKGRDLDFIRNFLAENNYYTRQSETNLICFPQ